MSSSRASFADIQRGAQIVRAPPRSPAATPTRCASWCAAWCRPAAATTRCRFPATGRRSGPTPSCTKAGVTELFYDLNWDPLIGSPDADPKVAGERAEEILTALAPGTNG